MTNGNRETKDDPGFGENYSIGAFFVSRPCNPGTLGDAWNGVHDVVGQRVEAAAVDAEAEGSIVQRTSAPNAEWAGSLQPLHVHSSNRGPCRHPGSSAKFGDGVGDRVDPVGGLEECPTGRHRQTSNEAARRLERQDPV